MQVHKLSVSFDPELGSAVRGAADRARQTLSSWLAEAAAAKLRADALADFLDSWEVEHGAITEEELAAAATRLRLTVPEANQASIDQDHTRSHLYPVTPQPSPSRRRRTRRARTAGAEK